MNIDLALAAKVASVVAAGAVELWAAVPAGLALGLHPALVAAAASLGGVASVIAVSFVGDGLRARLLGGHARRAPAANPSLIDRAWRSYGTPGLALVAPLVVGAPIGTALGIALGAPAGRLRAWMSVGVIAWSSGLAAAGAAGMEVIA